MMYCHVGHPARQASVAVELLVVLLLNTKHCNALGSLYRIVMAHMLQRTVVTLHSQV